MEEKENLENKEITSEDIIEERMSPEKLIEAIDSKGNEKLTFIFEHVPDADIALSAEEIEIPYLIRMFRKSKSEMTANIFDELSQEKKEQLIEAMTNKELVELVNEQYADDLADAVGEMPANLAQKVLKAASKDMRQDINKLLKYEEGTAGSIMTTEFLEFHESITVTQAIAEIRRIGKEAETVYTLFIRNAKRLFVGTVDLDDLIFANGDEKLSDIMNKDAPYCHASTDREEVANMFRKYDLNAMAVLNDDECLIGIVTVDDVIDVITEEATEDIEKMNAVMTLEDSYMDTSPWQMTKKCLPWIIILLILGTFSSMVLSSFQETLGRLTVLSAFIPVLTDTAGNTGGQSSALIIRGLALKEFEAKDYWKILWREIRSAIIIAIFTALFAFVWFTFEQYAGIVKNSEAIIASIGQEAYDAGGNCNIWLGNCWNIEFLLPVLKISGLVSITLLITTIFAKIIAVTLPIIAALFKKDPAITTQPLLTTIMDVASLLIYFVIAEIMILQFLPA